MSSSSPIKLQSGLCRGERPPIPSGPYKPEKALGDLNCVVYAMDEFLGNKMVESEEYLAKGDPQRERLYFATGVGLIQTVKSILSYADEDLLRALKKTKHANGVAAAHRKGSNYSVVSRLSGYLSGATHGNKWYNSMTDVELHAELTYAESLFEKALVGIVYSGDWIAFIKEALNMRTCISTYRALYSWLQSRDSEYSNVQVGDTDPPPKLQDPSIDPHFRSGIYLGAGMLNVILSMLPTRLLGLMEIFGLGSDRQLGLGILMAAGGWEKDKDLPSIGIDKEGVRRPLCDLGMLIFHLVLSTFTFDCVDVDFAEKLVKWNIERWPDGIFPLLAAGRLSLSRTQPQKAIEYYLRALDSQEQYRNLWHMCWWELAVSYLAVWDLNKSLEMWKKLMDEASWSKSIYTYGYACCLIEIAHSPTEEKEGKRTREEMLKEAKELMEKVPGLRQRIAGKSIPLEKFVARRAKKYLSSATSSPPLFHPAMELGMVFGGIARTTGKVIEESLLTSIRASLATLSETAEKRESWWDDLCLLRFLEALCCRYLVYPDPAAAIDEEEEKRDREEEDKLAEDGFRFVFENGKKIEWDHHLVYMAHYEFGRLLACRGDTAGAKREFELVLSGKPLEVNDRGRKGKYSLENALHVRTTGAMGALEKGCKRL